MEIKDLTLNEINRLRHHNYGNNDEVEGFINELMESVILSESNEFMMAEYALISSYLWGKGMTEEGKYYITKALEFSEYAVDKVSLVDVYIQAGNYASLEDNYGEALTWYYRALDLAESIDYNNEVARIYNNIGTLFIHCKNYEKGLEFLLSAEKYSKRYTDVLILSVLYNNLAEVYLSLGNNEKGLYYIDLMEGHLGQYASSIHKLNHMINKWKYALSVGDDNQMDIICIQSKKLLETIPYGNDYITTTLEIFNVMVKMGRVQEAVISLEGDIKKLVDASDYNNLSKIYSMLIDFYDEAKDHDKKMHFILKSHENDLCLKKAQLEYMSKSLEYIDKSRKHLKDEQEKNRSNLTALSTENSRLLAVNNNLRAIHDIGVNILSTTNLDEIFDILLKRVNQLFNVEEFAIGIIHDDEKTLYFNHSSKSNIKGFESAIVPLDNTDALTVKCFLENREILISDCEKEAPKRYRRNMERGEKLLSMVFLPIVVNDKPFGVMTVQHSQKNAFTSLHLEVFRLLATFVSVSFKNSDHNSKLTQEIDMRKTFQEELEDINVRLEHLAKHDDLTGVYNRRTFEGVYLDAFNESMNKGKALTVMIIDIDHFKQYNDVYGHLSGDECIIQVSKTLTLELKRQSDFIARYGGDEFMILLPDTDKEGAEVVASSLVKAIRELKLEHVGSPIDEFVTISLGAATKVITKDDQSEELLILADKALYHAKKELGRNSYYITD